MTSRLEHRLVAVTLPVRTLGQTDSDAAAALAPEVAQTVTTRPPGRRPSERQPAEHDDLPGDDGRRVRTGGDRRGRRGSSSAPPGRTRPAVGDRPLRGQAHAVSLRSPQLCVDLPRRRGRTPRSGTPRISRSTAGSRRPPLAGRRAGERPRARGRTQRRTRRIFGH